MSAIRHRRRTARFLAVLAVSTALATPALAGTLTGEVTDSGSIRALAGSTVTVDQLGRTVEVDGGGFYRIDAIPAGTYTVTARYVGATAEAATLTIAEDQQARLDFRLTAGGQADATILVVGQAANQASALSRQRAADGVENVLTRDAIGQFPDQNAAESLRRVPGIYVQDDQGEGRFVAIRGLAPNLNSVSINGARIPSPEAGGREVPLDVIPSELIESIEIRKTLTPDMEGDAIGGSIEINSTSPFDRRRSQVVATLEGSYNDLVDEISPHVSADFTWLPSDRFGISGGVSWYDRELGSNNIEAEDWGEEDGVAYPETIEWRDYRINRERLAGSLALEYRPSPGTSLYARGLASRYEDQEYRSLLNLSFDPAPVAGDGGSAVFEPLPPEEEDEDPAVITAVRELKDRLETQFIYSGVLGGSFEFDSWDIDASASYSYSEESEPDALYTVFEREFEPEDGIQVVLDGLDSFTPTFSTTNDALFSDPGEYELDEIEFDSGVSQDEEWGFRLDVAREFPLGGGTVTLQGGTRLRLRTKEYDLAVDYYGGFADGSDFPTLADFAGSVDYPLAPINPAIDPAIRSFVETSLGGLEREAADSDFDSAGAFYRVDEDIYAGYLLARAEVGSLRAIGGVRIEHTRNNLFGNIVELVEEGGIRDGIELEEDTTFVTPVAYERDYTRWLPSLNLRWEAAPDVVVRGAAYRAVVRPNIEQIAPRFLVEESDDGEREGEFGNPALRPYDAWNFDAGVEWYFLRNAVLQGNIFYKEIEDFIATVRIEDQLFNGVFVDEATVPVNGNRATVTGLEVNLQAALDFLPSPLDGLLVGANYTYTDSSAELFGRDLPLPSTSENVWNATLGYEKGPVSLRVTASYRDDFLAEVSEDGTADLINRSRLLLDVSARLRITDNIQLYGNFVNLTDEPYGAFFAGTDAGGRRLAQHEEYSWTGQFGVRVTLP